MAIQDTIRATIRKDLGYTLAGLGTRAIIRDLITLVRLGRQGRILDARSATLLSTATARTNRLMIAAAAKTRTTNHSIAARVTVDRYTQTPATNIT